MDRESKIRHDFVPLELLRDSSSSAPAPAAAPSKSKIDLEAIRARLSAARGPQYWRSLEELANTEEFHEAIKDEFSDEVRSTFKDPVTRRDFLKVMSASLALAGLSACTKQPLEPIVPYVRQPEELIPGKPLYFATAMPLSGYAIPLLAKSDMGRPIKVEGNPEHPASGGGTDIFSQGSLLGLYDPDRSQTITYLGEVRPWGAFLAAVRGPLAAQQAVQGAGLRILTETISSPSLAAQLRAVLQHFPQAKWHQYEPVNRDSARAGSQMAFGKYLETKYRLDAADVILSLDADFLSSGFPGFVRYARDFALRRKPEAGRLSRLYVVESTPSNAGAKADHRLPMRASEVQQFARAVGAALGIGSAAAPKPEHPNWIRALIADLQQHRGSSVVIPGEQQPALVHALAHAMNAALGNVGKTVIHTDSVEANPVDQMHSLRELVNDMKSGKVETLLLLAGNPVFDAPADLDFAAAMSKVQLKIQLAEYQNETTFLCHWHLNQAHYLESWGDARAHDGTVSMIQPLIAPLYGGKSALEILAVVNNQPDVSGYDLLRAFWQKQHPAPDFEDWWRRSLHDGFMPGSALPPATVALKKMDFGGLQTSGHGVEIIFRPDPTIYDGRFANNAWLQELPKPMTELTWDNPALIGPAKAQAQGLNNEDMVELEHQGRKVKAAIWVQPGHPPDSMTVFLGYGRRRVGRVGSGLGFNAYQLRTSGAPWIGADLKISKTGESYKLASTQGHQAMEGRDIVRAASLEEFTQNPSFAHVNKEEPERELTLYPNYEYKEYAWGMAIDLNSCVGCKACVIACQAENNIPVVGKTEVIRQRKMHWLRVDNYYQGDPQNPRMYFQPVPCMHCENAPCEPVCPVAATVHSSEGLNDMVYNRCVGTRYCSNNCPYKVRRFNFFLFQDWNTPQFKLMRNPDVTVRSRGVMEKCTYCVQRITRGRIEAEKQERRIRDLEVQTACQQACPADAIVFGDINDRNSRVARLKAQQRNYSLLAELNTRPRTTYLAAVLNLNPALQPTIGGNAEKQLKGEPNPAALQPPEKRK